MAKRLMDIIDGREQAKARDEFLESEGGRELTRGTAEGQYLRNRLEVAFSEGLEAGARLAMESLIVGALRRAED